MSAQVASYFKQLCPPGTLFQTCRKFPNDEGSWHAQKRVCVSCQKERNMNVLTIFRSICNQREFCSCVESVEL